ncbi:MAG: SH3 domain-containing protein [Alphaproteobacteria bacterium]
MPGRISRALAALACSLALPLSVLLPALLLPALLLPTLLLPTGDAAAESSLKLPRFVTLRASEINARAGPGLQYPIKWVYRRPGLPVEVVKEFDNWRMVRDHEGGQAWIVVGALSPRRAMLITGAVRTLRARPAADAPSVAQAEPGVLGRLIECNAENWCRAEISGIRGWLRRGEFWGTYKGEIVK